MLESLTQPATLSYSWNMRLPCQRKKHAGMNTSNTACVHLLVPRGTNSRSSSSTLSPQLLLLPYLATVPGRCVVSDLVIIPRSGSQYFFFLWYLQIFFYIFVSFLFFSIPQFVFLSQMEFYLIIAYIIDLIISIQ